MTDEHTTESNEPCTVPVPTATGVLYEEGGHGVPIGQQLILLTAILFLLLGGAITPKIIAFFQEEAEVTPAAPAFIETTDPENNIDAVNAQEIKPFSEVSITGKAAYVWDVKNQRALYKKNESAQLPIASVAKLMTALVAHELLAEEDAVAVGNEAVRQYGNSGLLEGETFDRLDLTDLVLISSSNDGAYALASAAGSMLATENTAGTFVQAMNIRAEELGLHDTTFKNPTGLDIDETTDGGTASAKDIAFLMEYIAQNEPKILAYTTEQNARVYSADGTYHDAENTNYYIQEIPGLIGSKTGYTDLAGGNLVVIFNAGLDRPIVVSVLGSTRHERFTDVVRLVEETQRYIAQY